MSDSKSSRNGPTMLEATPAYWDHWRSVRVVLDGKDQGLATTAYSYLLSDSERAMVALRIAVLWNLHLDDSNDALLAKLEERKP